MKDISIIIPTRDRKAILAKTLESFLGQGYPKEKYEIIVVDDGSVDNTEELFTPEGEYGVTVKYFRQPQRGPAAARNLGIKNAAGEIILIVNDDAIAEPGLIEEHINWHRRYPQEYIGVLGFLTWSKELEITPFMHWLECGGPQFDYSQIQGIDATWKRFWACNVSLKKAFLLDAGLFNEEFPYAAWEDIELGYRLHLKGFKLVYNRKAAAYHYHQTTLESAKEQMVRHGRNAALLADKVPLEYLPVSIGRYSRLFILLDSFFLVKPILALLERLAGYLEKRVRFGFLFDLILLHYRLSGLKNG